MMKAGVIFALTALLFELGIPWWSIVPLNFGVGWTSRRDLRATFFVSIASAVAWVTLAFMQDARTEFRVSRRLAGLFSLPQSWLIYAVLGLIALLTSATAVSAGWMLRRNSDLQK